MSTDITTMDVRTVVLDDNNLVISCEHGGNRIPDPYRELFKAHQALLSSHRGFDIGALSMAKDLATAFAAPLVYSTTSRLLVDLNRSIGSPNLHYEAIRKQPSELRDLLLKQYYQPYRTQAEHLIRKTIANHGQVIHLSAHSFTPILAGKVRNADIGLLFDPVRASEVSLCQSWKQALKICLPELTIRRNYPYKGKGDGLTRYFRQLFPPETYVGIELEINQKHIINNGGNWAAIRKAVIKSLRMALSKGSFENSYSA